MSKTFLRILSGLFLIALWGSSLYALWYSYLPIHEGRLWLNSWQFWYGALGFLLVLVVFGVIALAILTLLFELLLSLIYFTFKGEWRFMKE